MLSLRSKGRAARSPSCRQGVFSEVRDHLIVLVPASRAPNYLRAIHTGAPTYAVPNERV